MKTKEILSHLNQARLCIESLGSQLERYHEPAWKYRNTLNQLNVAILKIEQPDLNSDEAGKD